MLFWMKYIQIRVSKTFFQLSWLESYYMWSWSFLQILIIIKKFNNACVKWRALNYDRPVYASCNKGKSLNHCRYWFCVESYQCYGNQFQLICGCWKWQVQSVYSNSHWTAWCMSSSIDFVLLFFTGFADDLRRYHPHVTARDCTLMVCTVCSAVIFLFSTYHQLFQIQTK